MQRRRQRGVDEAAALAFLSCFAVTPAEHDANRRLAQERGVY